MLYAYGATVVEVVRRKEFARFFYQRAQSILEIMAKLTASERKRRQLYRGEVYGQLPFETVGMDAPVPSIDFSPTGASDLPYSLERADIDGGYFSIHFCNLHFVHVQRFRTIESFGRLATFCPDFK